MSVRLTTLGGLHAARGDVELEGLLSQRLRAALLVYLAVERRVARDVLTAVFWPESDEANARHALRQSLYQLRRALGEECIEARAHELRATDAVHTDVEAFESAVARGDAAAAAKLYAGPFLNGVHLADLQGWEAWVDAQRSRYARAFRKASREWVDGRTAAGDAAGAVEAAQHWVASDPTDDEAQHRLIEALAAAGDHADALRQYEAYVRLLEPDGLKPLDASVSLAESLRRGGTRTGAAGTRGRPHVDAPLGRARSAGSAERSAWESGASRAPLPDAASGARPQRKVRIGARALSAVAILLAGTAVVTLWRRPQPADSPDDSPRLAVLPFQDDTGGNDFEWLAAGVTSGLTDALHEASMLTVTPTSGVRLYRDGVTPLPAIARELDVDWLIGGNVARRGDAVVVRAELIDSAGRLVDSREVDGAPDEALRLVGEVVDEVSSFLRVRIGDEVRVRGWSAGTRSEAAFRLLHGADRDVAAADLLGADGHLDAARSILMRADSALLIAARADERWAEPHIQRALVARKLGVLAARSAEAVEQVAAAFEAGIAHAEQAHRRAPGSAAALEARGVLRHTLWLHAKPADPQAAARLLGDAEADLRAASAADPSRAKALSVLSTIQFARNEYALARASAERAYAADAYLDEAREILARLFNITFEGGDDAAAERWCSELRRRFPDFWFGTSCRLALRTWAADSQPDPGGAWTETSHTIDAQSPEYRPMIRAQLEMQMAGVLARAGFSDSAGRVLDRARARAFGDTTFSRYRDNAIELLPYEAEVRGLLGQRDSAASLMDRYLDLVPDVRRRFMASRRFRGLEIS